MKNTTAASPAHFSISIIDIFYNSYRNIREHNICELPFYITPFCKWMPTAAFQKDNPKIIYQQIIKINNQKPIFHKICYCYLNQSKNCNMDTFGPIYPGQTLQLELCTPCKNELSIIYAEINNVHLPTVACKVAFLDEKINIISNYSTKVNFTIVSGGTNKRELFLTAASADTASITETFNVLFSSCPVGFTLQNGVCSCDPILSPYIAKCYIDLAAIRRPPNTWITDHTEGNDTKYLISSCPIDYCIPHSTNINLLYSD